MGRTRVCPPRAPPRGKRCDAKSRSEPRNDPPNSEIILVTDSTFKSHGVAAIYLHGSQVEGRSVSSSDIDVAVLLEDPPKGWEAVEDLRCELEHLIAAEMNANVKKLDVVFLHEAPPAFCYRAIKPGRILWESDTHTRVHFEARLMSEYLDYRFFEDIHDRALTERIREGKFGHRPSVRQKTAG